MIFGEDESEPQHQPPHPERRQVRVDASSIETIYANSFALASSADEITVYLGVNLPLPGMKQPTVKVSHRMVLIPQNAKRMALLLQQAVKTYEERFGPIELPPPPQGGRPG
jgi:hypothetical protein